MTESTNNPAPVVEPNSGGGDIVGTTTKALQLRIRQQEILAELGVVALQPTPFIDLLNQTARLVAEGLEAEFCKVLEYVAAEKRLLVRAGIGWKDGVVGVATIGTDLESPSGFALRTGRPVISNHLENEERFRTPELLLEHGIRRAMNVIIQGDGAPYGVLEVDSRSTGEFTEADIPFLQGAANILGMAIERQRYERDLQTALNRQQLLLGEINHRVKNSLQIVSSMLHLQARSAEDANVAAQLADASSRVAAVGRAYERLAYDPNVESIDLRSYLQAVCEDAIKANADCQFHFEGPEGIRVDADRAISLALIVNELVTNSVKHAFVASAQKINIFVRLARAENGVIRVSVQDDGAQPPPAPSTTSKGLGMRIIAALAQQLNAEITRSSSAAGNEVVVVVPVERNS